MRHPENISGSTIVNIVFNKPLTTPADGNVGNTVYTTVVSDRALSRAGQTNFYSFIYFDRYSVENFPLGQVSKIKKK